MTSSAEARSPATAAVPPAPTLTRTTNQRAAIRRIPLRDRAWMPFHTVRAAGPIRPPSIDLVRDLLVQLWSADPQHPLLCRIDEQRGWQQPVSIDDLDAYLSSVVIEAQVDADAVGLARLLQAVPLGGLPFVIVISDHAAAMRSAHVIGDTATANPWFFGLLRAADPERALSMITAGRSSHFPLAAALIKEFGRDPRGAVRALRHALPLGPAGKSVPELPTVASGIPELINETAAPGLEADLRRWRAEHAPKASVAALWMAAAVRALRAEGIDPGHGVFTMMNGRRYLPEGAAVRGNFAAGPYLVPDDLGDPSSLGSELASAATDGVPLVLLTAITARSLFRLGRPGRMPIGGGGNPKLNLSHFGSIADDDLDWDVTDRDPHARYVVAAEPAGPNAITYVFARSPYGMHLSATAHQECIDVVALRSALHRVSTDPVGLLDEAS